MDEDAMHMAHFQYQPYEYEPLNEPNSIRVVSPLDDTLNPVKPTIFGQPLIQLCLDAIELNENRDFEALPKMPHSPFVDKPGQDTTYSPELNRCPIAVNGRLLFVGQNVYDFLRHFPWTGAEEPDVDLERTPELERTALMTAAQDGELDEVQSLLLKGASVHAVDANGQTALHRAAFGGGGGGGHYKIAKLLVRAGADVNKADRTGKIPSGTAWIQERRNYQLVNFLCRPDLQHAERQRLEPLGSPKNQWIWIEEICCSPAEIKSNDYGVPGHTILEHAKSSLIWIGVEDEHTAFVHQAVEHFRVNHTFVLNDTIVKVWEEQGAQYKKTNRIPKFDQWPVGEKAVAIRQYWALFFLHQRSWFSLSDLEPERNFMNMFAKSIKLVCGKYVFDFSDFGGLCNYHPATFNRGQEEQ
ncbi:hypothetical protein MW887_000894 [Aspergillus wentii]|nr:hypothetical protein MW887_000894 [Aspergillus wentii]